MLTGKKTYITAALMVAASIMQATGTEIPGEVWPILTAFGLGFIRNAIG